MTFINSPVLKLLLDLKHNTRQNKQVHLGFSNSITSSGEITTSFTGKNSYQWQPPNSGAKHIKAEEGEHF